MTRLSRRSFVQSVGIAAAVPAFGAVPLAAAQAQAAEAEDIRVEKDIVFGKGGDMDLLLDVYHPAAANAKRMALIHLYGGGFFTGSKQGVATSSRAFAGQGYVSIASTYRLTGQARWPSQIEDVKAAIRWTRANANRLNIDADKIGVAGYSAGGMLALFAAGTGDLPQFEGTGGNAGVSSKVAACVAFYAATRATPNLMPEGGANEATLAAASPGTYVSPDFAPTIFLHGIADTTIPYTSSLDFFNRLHEAGVKVDLHLLQGAPHAYETRNEDAALASAQVSNLFLDRVVVNPKEYPPFGFGGRGPGGPGGPGRAPQ
jgi:acetyl esterase/lipase